MRKRTYLFGVAVDDISLEWALSLARKSILNNETRIFFTPNLEMIELARREVQIKELLNRATVSLPDGYGLKIISALLGKELKNTVAGVDFGEAMIKSASRLGARVYLLGGRDGVAKAAADKLCERYSTLCICGYHHGYFKYGDIKHICDKINSTSPDILIVCQGFPKQEQFILKAISHLDSVKVFAGLGGSMDIWAGEQIRAPYAMRNMHLEWLWRVSKEPKRIKRFVASLPSLYFAACEGIKNSCTLE